MHESVRVVYRCRKVLGLWYGCMRSSSSSFSLQGDYIKAQCIHCNVVVRRGKEGALKKECYNSSMLAHLKAKHSDVMMQVIIWDVCFV